MIRLSIGLQENLLPSNQRNDQNGDLFISLEKIFEKAQIKIIQLGFQPNQEGKLSLKEDFEGKRKDKLFE